MSRKRTLILVVYFTLLALGMAQVIPTLAQSATETGAATFKTPEDAITTFFEGITQADIEKIYSACAIDETGENFKFDLTIERLGALMPTTSLAPSNSPLFVQINKDTTKSRIAMQVKLFAFSLLSSEPIDLSTATVMDGDAARKFAQDVDPSRLSGVKLLKVGLPGKDIMSNERYIANAKRSAATVGADESTERVALFSFEGSDYMLGFTLLRFGDNWKIYTVSSPIANTSALGIAVQMSEADFDELTK